MICLLLACTAPIKTITLPNTSACLTQRVHTTLPELDVREVQVLEGELMLRAQGGDLELRLPSGPPGQPSVLIAYRAGPLGRRHRTRIFAPREQSVTSLAPEPATWRVDLRSLTLGGQASSRANLLGFEGQIEARLELCVSAGACKHLSPGQMLWAPAEQARRSTMRLRDKDLLFNQKISDEYQISLSVGLNELDIEGSHLSLFVHSYSPLPAEPVPLTLGELSEQRLSFEGPHPQAWIVDLERPQTLHVALISPNGEVELGLHSCDGRPYATAQHPTSDVALVEQPLEQGRWLLRAGLSPQGVGAARYQILAATSAEEFEQVLALEGIVLP